MKDDLHYALTPGRSAKQQALDVLKKLQLQGVPIARARMHVKVHLATDVIGTVGSCLLAFAGAVLERFSCFFACVWLVT
jgi:ribosome maturation protein Sdo1